VLDLKNNIDDVNGGDGRNERVTLGNLCRKRTEGNWRAGNGHPKEICGHNV